MRATKATVRLGAIGHNVKAVMQLARNSKVLPVIKANAYGHGAVEVARKLESFRSLDVPAMAVAMMDEAVQLRQAGISRPLLVLQGSNQVSDVAEAAANDIWLMVNNAVQMEHIAKSRLSQPLTVWVKVDTGMHRLGFDEDRLAEVISTLLGSDKVHNKMVLCSHLACAEELDNPLTGMQVEQLQRLAGLYNMHWSMAHSAGIIGWPQSHGDWVRPGYMLYGNSPMAAQVDDSVDEPVNDPVDDSGRIGTSTKDPAQANKVAGHGHQTIRLQPAMTVTSEIISIRRIAAGEAVGYGHAWVAPAPATIGVVGIGYADGYPRHAVSGTPVWLNGQRVPLAGRVSMDMITVDISGVSNAAIGDQVELWGQNLSVNEVATYAGTIGYEILAGLTKRVSIEYLP